MEHLSDRHLEAVHLLGVGFRKKEVAEMLGVSEQSIYNWLNDGLFQNELERFREERRKAFVNMGIPVPVGSG